MEKRKLLLFYVSYMCTFDILVAILIVASFVIGMFKGLVKELAGLLGLLVGIFGAVKLSGLTEQLLREHFDINCAGVVSFALTLVILVIAIHFLAAVVDKAINVTVLSLPNKILGGVICAVKNLFIASCCICIANYFLGDVIDLLGENEKEQSITYGFMTELAQMVYPYLDFGVSQLRETMM